MLSYWWIADFLRPIKPLCSLEVLCMPNKARYHLMWARTFNIITEMQSKPEGWWMVNGISELFISYCKAVWSIWGCWSRARLYLNEHQSKYQIIWSYEINGPFPFCSVIHSRLVPLVLSEWLKVIIHMNSKILQGTNGKYLKIIFSRSLEIQ